MSKTTLSLRLLLLLLAGPSVIAAVPASAQDFRRGLSSYNRADYSAALAEWLPLAKRGDANAQAGLGYLYFKGLGVAQNYAAAADWYARAAEQGEPQAQLFLGSMYFSGDGVRQSYVLAYAWCELAQANGAPDALLCREAAGRRLSAAEMRESSRLVTEWFVRHASVPNR